MIHYFDASALAKRYFLEPGSDVVGRLVMVAGSASSRLSESEVASGLARRAREGALTTGERDRQLGILRADFADLKVIELTPEVSATAVTLLGRHALRAGDAIQLASCLHLQRGLGRPVTFVAFDDRLNAAARREGLAGP